MENPWLVDNVEAFNFLCCPECMFKSKELEDFKGHAVQSHPMSLALFKVKEEQTVIKSEPIDPLDVLETQITNEEPSSKQSEVEEDNECRICQLRFSNSHQWRTHMKTDHKVVEEPMLEKTNMIKEWECKICFEKFFSFSHWKVHNQSQHKKVKTYTCFICLDEFTNAEDSINHLKTVHVNVPCDRCHLICKDPIELRKHRIAQACKNVNEILPEKKKRKKSRCGKQSTQSFYQCPGCVQTFTKKVHMQIHVKENHQSAKNSEKKESDDKARKSKARKSISCPAKNCLVLFKKQTELQNHMKEHHPIWSCDECSAEFSKNYKLQIHVRYIHTEWGQAYRKLLKSCTSWPCQLCHSKHKSRIRLQMHVKKHHPESLEICTRHSFQCSACLKTFQSFKILWDHIQSEHPGRKCEPLLVNEDCKQTKKAAKRIKS